MAQTTTAGVIAALDAINGLIGSSGEVRVYTGSAPANADASSSGTLLATFDMDNPAFAGAVADSNDALATANTISDDISVDNTGTPGYYRIVNGSGTTVYQGSVSATGGGGELQFNNTSWVATGTATITAFTIRIPRP